MLWAVRLWFPAHAFWKTFLTVIPGRWRRWSWPSTTSHFNSSGSSSLSVLTMWKVVVLHFQKFFSWSFILSVCCLMSRLTVVSSSGSVNQFSTSLDLAIMIYHNHKRNLRWNSVVKSQYLLKDYAAEVSETPALLWLTHSFIPHYSLSQWDTNVLLWFNV